MTTDPLLFPAHSRARRRRHEIVGHARFLTFGCFRHLPLLDGAAIKDRFIDHLSASRSRHGFRLHAYVVMPDHVHLLLTPNLPCAPVSTVMQQLKRDFAIEAMKLLDDSGQVATSNLVAANGRRRFWQRGGGYDRNIFSMDEAIEKMKYIHANPVRKGLAARPIDYPWSSARWWDGQRDETFQLDSFE